MKIITLLGNMKLQFIIQRNISIMKFIEEKILLLPLPALFLQKKLKRHTKSLKPSLNLKNNTKNWKWR
jgi:hypothetical protein